MTTIGTFSPTDAGGFNGAIRTLTLQSKAAIIPAGDTAAAGADYLVFFERQPAGRAWRGEDGVVRVRLEHPSFREPMQATLRPRDALRRVYALDWERPASRAPD